MIKLLICTFFVAAFAAVAQEVYNGYVLFGPDHGNTAYLVDQEKNIVHTWEDLPSGGYRTYLRENGNIVRPADSDSPGLGVWAPGGLVQEIDPAGNVVWEFNYKGEDYCPHHDIEPMPNGNVLLIVREVYSAEEAAEAGFNGEGEISPGYIAEIQPPQGENGEASVVWEWHVWDHMTTGNEPELFNIGIGDTSSSMFGGGFGGGFTEGDWMHMNGISYNPDLDQIAFTAKYLDEIYVIDHSTTTEEAAGSTGGNSGMGGDLLFRWGKPENYGETGTDWFDGLHSAAWVPSGYPGEGNLMAYNNGGSTVYEISPQKDGEYNYVIDSNLEPAWTYSGSDFFEDQGSCQPLPNGNTFICNPPRGQLFEVNEEGEVVWEYTYAEYAEDSDNAQVPGARKYGADHPGIQVLVGQATSENKGIESKNTSPADVLIKGDRLVFKGLKSSGIAEGTARVFDISGKEVLKQRIGFNERRMDISSLPSMMYVVRLRSEKGRTIERLINRIE